MPHGHVDRVARIRQACSTMEELHEQTRLLYESITAEARRTRAVAPQRKYPKKIRPRRSDS
jgi:hypothetical protein